MIDYLEDELLPDELPHDEDTGGHVPVASGVVSTTNAGQVSQAGHQGIYSTSIVNSSQPVTQLLGRDDDRTAAVVVAVDGPVILGSSQQTVQQALAAQPASPVTSPEASSAVYVPAGLSYPVVNGDELWAGMVGSTATRVSVQVARRLP